jgi:hypothetical protein
MTRYAVLGTAAALLLGFWAAGAARAGDDHPQCLVSSCAASSPATVRGEVAVTDSPFCEFFVVGTEQGFSLLDWRGGLYVIAEGDRLGGPLHEAGLHVFASGSIAKVAIVSASVTWGAKNSAAQRNPIARAGRTVEASIMRRLLL